MRTHRRYCRYWAHCDHCNISVVYTDPIGLGDLMIEHRRQCHPELPEHPRTLVAHTKAER
jgi:hypothetical protein